MSLILSALAVTASCVPADKPAKSNAEIVSAFFTAFNANDQAGMGALIKPGALLVMGPGDTLELAGLLSNLSPGARLDVLEMKSGGPTVVTVRTRSHEGVEATGTVTLQGGCITEFTASS